jgi:hypothetical protein
VLGASGSTLLSIGSTLLPALTMMGSTERRPYGRLGLGPVQERECCRIDLASFSLFSWHEPLVRWFAHNESPSREGAATC